VLDEVGDESSGEIIVVPRKGGREDGDLQSQGILFPRPVDLGAL
jgi:hypothetical protein